VACSSFELPARVIRSAASTKRLDVCGRIKDEGNKQKVKNDRKFKPNQAKNNLGFVIVVADVVVVVAVIINIVVVVFVVGGVGVGFVGKLRPNKREL